MIAKPSHYAKALYELTEAASESKALRAVEALARLLAAKNRAGMLEQILSEYRKLLLKRNALSEMEIKIAAPLSAEMKKAIFEKMGAPKETVVKEIVDPSLVGGVSVKYNDTLFDTSLKRKLKSLEQALIK